MCRMIAFVGSRDTDLQIIYSAFREGSQCDPYAQAVFGPGQGCHPHGWGYALYDGINLHHFRSSRPAWEEQVRLPAIRGPYVYAIFHSRLASNPALNSAVCSHPFLLATDKEILLLAHNGGVQTEPSTPQAIVDSEWALGRIADMGIEAALPLLKDRTLRNSALNLILLAIPRDKNTLPAVHGLNFFKTEDPARRAYYTMYVAEFGGGKLFFSSTFKDLKMNALAKIEAAPFEELFSLQSNLQPEHERKADLSNMPTINT